MRHRKVPKTRETERWSCGCFIDVYVCPEHLARAGRILGGLTQEDQYGMFDSVGSVSALESEAVNGN